MKLVNLTPHAICLQAADGVRTTVLPSGSTARVSSTPGTLRNRDGIPVPVAGATVYGEVEGIPPPEEGVVYIVSGMVLGRTNRPDVLAPGTGPADGAIRENGQIVAVTRLVGAI